jgi:histidinol-phosphate phosphatase family protein
MRAAIIAGGKGTRIRSLSGNLLPKSLVPVAGIPIIFRQLQLLSRYGLSEVAVIAGHLAEPLQAAVSPEARRLGIRLEFFVETQPLGTAGGLVAARDFLAGEDFCVMYGDMAVEMDLARLRAFHHAKQGLATVVVHPNDHPDESDIVLVNNDQRITRILPRKDRPQGYYRNLVPTGVYCLSPSIFDHIPRGEKQDFVHDVFPRLLGEPRGVFACNTPEYLRDVGTPERHALVEKDILSGLMARANFARKRQAVFLDRDGVLVEEVDRMGLIDPDRLALTPRAAAAVRLINDAGSLAIVVTNQPQLAKGLLSQERLELIHAKLETLLGRQKAKLDAIYFCPHHPERGHPGEVLELKINCSCRKPKPGQLEAAARDLPVLLEESCVIGDSARDVGAAKSLGLYAYGVRTGYGCRDCTGPLRPDLIFADVFEAAHFAVLGLPSAERISDRLHRQAGSGSRVLVVGIAGLPRSGKSTLAHAVVRALRRFGTQALHICLDDWIMPCAMHPAATAMQPEERGRPELYPSLLADLLSGETVVVLGHESASRDDQEPSGCRLTSHKVLILDGSFACHPSIRPQLDLSVFVDAPESVLHDRFATFYRWQGFPDKDICQSWGKRRMEEWPVVLRQRESADEVVCSQSPE